MYDGLDLKSLYLIVILSFISLMIINPGTKKKKLIIFNHFNFLNIYIYIFPDLFVWCEKNPFPLIVWLLFCSSLSGYL